MGVDPQSRDRIYDLLASMAASGTSLLLTTHHIEEAEARCARTVILDHGRVVAAGTTAELVEQTVGRQKLVSLRLGAPLAGGESLARAAAVEWRPDDPLTLRARMADVAVGLPPLLARIAGAGGTVTDVEVRGPSLQSVFIHLTGKDLRE